MPRPFPDRYSALPRPTRLSRNPVKRLAGAGAIILLTVLIWIGDARAESRTPQRAGSIGFADFAPESTGLFIGVRRLRDLDAALDRARAWQFLIVLSGGSVDRAPSLDLPKALASLLGLRGTADPTAWADSEVGIALSPSMNLGSAVWFVRLSDPRLLDRWFPPAGRLEAGSTGAIRHFRLRTGWKVAVSGRIIALSRRWEPGSFFAKTLSVMSGRGAPLARFLAFRNLSAYLPGDYLALIYLAGVRSGDDKGVAPPLSWWPAARHVMVGLFERDGRLDVAIRAALGERGSTAKLSRRVIDRLLRLPQTTLMAAATTLDIAQLRGAQSGANPPGLLERYLAFLGGLQDPARVGDAERPQLGPHVLLAWGQDLRAGGSTPQLALLVECGDGKAVRRRTRQMVEGLLKFVQVLEPTPLDAAPAIVHSRHLGATIYSVPLSAYADKSGLAFMSVVRDASPSFTVWSGWLILTASRDHLERILDAQYGLIPGLATVGDVRGLRLSASDRTAVSIVQPDLATKVLDGWLATHDAGGPSFLDSSWWGGQSVTVAADDGSFLPGIELTEEPAVVVVERVGAGSPAKQLLAVGDRIIGIDGRLLSTTGARRDLEKLWAGSANRPGPTLRVQRDGEVLDVVIPHRPTRTTGRRIDPAGAVRELAAVGRTLEFGSYAVDVTDADHFSARISLRFRAPHASKAKTE